MVTRGRRQRARRHEDELRRQRDFLSSSATDPEALVRRRLERGRHRAGVNPRSRAATGRARHDGDRPYVLEVATRPSGSTTVRGGVPGARRDRQHRAPTEDTVADGDGRRDDRRVVVRVARRLARGTLPDLGMDITERKERGARAATFACPHRRGRGRRAAAPGAQSPRRRPAAARLALARTPPGAGEDRDRSRAAARDPRPGERRARPRAARSSASSRAGSTLPCSPTAA